MSANPYLVIAGFFAGVVMWFFFCRMVGKYVAQKRLAEMQSAPKGRYAEIQDAIRRSQVG